MLEAIDLLLETLGRIHTVTATGSQVFGGDSVAGEELVVFFSVQGLGDAQSVTLYFDGKFKIPVEQIKLTTKLVNHRKPPNVELSVCLPLL